MSEHTVGCTDILSVTFASDPCWPAIYAADAVMAAAVVLAVVGIALTNIVDWRMRRRASI